MSEITTDRRAFLAAAPALAVLTAGPAIALASTGDPGFERCLQAYREASARAEHFDRTVCQPANKRYDAECEQVRHITVDTFKSDSGAEIPWTTADPFMCGMAQEFGPLNKGSAAAKLLDAINQREAALKEIGDRHRIDALNGESDRLGALAGDALMAVEEYPVRSLGDLIRKMELSDAEGYADADLATLLADLRRIDGEVRS